MRHERKTRWIPSALWGVLTALLLGVMVASAPRSLASEAPPTTSSRPSSAAAAALARGHGAGHDRRTDAALAAWIARGRPAGRSAPVFPQEETADKTITLHTEGSNLEFTPNSISAPAGSRLRIEYENGGVLPHNFVLLYDDNDLDILGQASYEAQETGFVPVEQYEDKMIAYTKLASPGETVEVTFEVPPPGEYTFACIFPGHYNVMIGTLRSTG